MQLTRSMLTLYMISNLLYNTHIQGKDTEHSASAVLFCKEPYDQDPASNTIPATTGTTVPSGI